MFNIFNKKEVESLEKSLERYSSSKINELNSENDSLRNKIIDLERKLNEQDQKNRNASYEVDFKKMQAFSIERAFENDSWCTVIGYIIPSEPSKIREWNLLCSIEVHEALVRKFREYMKS